MNGRVDTNRGLGLGWVGSGSQRREVSVTEESQSGQNVKHERQEGTLFGR